MRGARIIWVALFLPLAAAGVASLWWPMGRDQGIYAWVGSVILNGGAPYRDAWEVKGPAAHLTYALAQLVFGHNMWGIRLLDLLLLCGGATWAGLALRRRGAGVGALVAPWIFVAWHWQLGFWSSAQPDVWIGVLLLAGLAALLLDTEAKRPRTALGVGAIFGFCALLKPLFGWLVVLPALHALVDRRRDAAAWRYAGLAVAGFAAPIALVFAWLAAKGAFGDFLDIQLVFNRSVHLSQKVLPPSEHLAAMYRLLAAPERLVILPLVWVGAVALWRADRRSALLLVTSLVLALACLAVQRKYFLYQAAPALAAAALLAGSGIGRIAELARAGGERGAPWRRHLAAALIVPALAVNVAEPWSAARAWLRYVTGGIPEREYYARFGAGLSDFSYLEIRRAADYVRGRTRPGDTVLVWAGDPLINYLSERRPPTRFGVHYPLTRGSHNPLERTWRGIFMDDLRARPPAYVVVADADRNELMPKTSRQSLEDFPEFRVYLERNYRRDGQSGRFAMWRRSNATASTRRAGE